MQMAEEVYVGRRENGSGDGFMGLPSLPGYDRKHS